MRKYRKKKIRRKTAARILQVTYYEILHKRWACTWLLWWILEREKLNVGYLFMGGGQLITKVNTANWHIRNTRADMSRWRSLTSRNCARIWTLTILINVIRTKQILFNHFFSSSVAFVLRVMKYSNLLIFKYHSRLIKSWIFDREFSKNY